MYLFDLGDWSISLSKSLSIHVQCALGTTWVSWKRMRPLEWVIHKHHEVKVTCKWNLQFVVIVDHKRDSSLMLILQVDGTLEGVLNIAPEDVSCTCVWADSSRLAVEWLAVMGSEGLKVRGNIFLWRRHGCLGNVGNVQVVKKRWRKCGRDKKKSAQLRPECLAKVLSKLIPSPSVMRDFALVIWPHSQLKTNSLLQGCFLCDQILNRLTRCFFDVKTIEVANQRRPKSWFNCLRLLFRIQDAFIFAGNEKYLVVMGSL